MPFQGTRDASDIMVKHVPQEPSAPRTKTSGKPSHHQLEITMEPELEGGQSGGPLIVDQPNFIETHPSLAQEHSLTSLEPDQIQEVCFDDLVAPSNSTYFGFTFPSPFCYNKIIQYISNT
jgi:hypothetical protein